MKSRRTAKSGVSREDVDRLVGRFLQDLERRETSPRTRQAYRQDRRHFADWSVRTLGGGLQP